ncbi:MAG TPA: flavodoxin domain-containing protein [Erysipelotrichaceae bacterium]|nr:flavodoxin domain-containing protein [Erysipelotrichaceae bacterium]
MHKLAVVYWTSSGNTETMADAIIEGAKLTGAIVDKIPANKFTPIELDKFDSIAFGCPAMGDELLDEYEFEPMFQSVLPHLTSKRFALFGSYGWGTGEWMRTWETICNENGATPSFPSIIANYAPDDSVIEELKELGKNLTK